jgi:hypothetical protein
LPPAGVRRRSRTASSPAPTSRRTPCSADRRRSIPPHLLASDFSREGLGNIDTDEVDPIAEAEVYLAYGRDAQAEEILKEALKKDPQRHEIYLKLLEIHAQHNKPSAFETVAAELYSVSQGQGEVWQKAVGLGRQLDPNNPMFAESGSAAATAAAVAASSVRTAAVEAPVRRARTSLQSAGVRAWVTASRATSATRAAGRLQARRGNPIAVVGGQAEIADRHSRRRQRLRRQQGASVSMMSPQRRRSRQGGATGGGAPAHHMDFTLDAPD